MDDKLIFLTELSHKFKNPDDVKFLLDNLDMGMWDTIRFLFSLHFLPVLITTLIVAALTCLVLKKISGEIAYLNGKELIRDAEKKAEKIHTSALSKSQKVLADLENTLKTSIDLQRKIEKPIIENKSLREILEGKNGYFRRILAQENYNETYTKKMAVKGLDYNK